MKNTLHLPVVAAVAIAGLLVSCVSQTQKEPVLPFSADPSCAGLSEKDRSVLDKWGGFMGSRNFYDMSSRELVNYVSSRDFRDVEGEAVRSYRRVSAAGRREIGLILTAWITEHQDKDIPGDILKQCADIAGGFFALDVKRESGGECNVSYCMLQHFAPIFILDGVVCDSSLPCELRVRAARAVDMVSSGDGAYSEEGFAHLGYCFRNGYWPSGKVKATREE